MVRHIRERFPGISCACRDAAGTITTECFGLADRDNGRPVDAKTLFPACSISKFVTALCVMKLHELGMLEIGAPVNDGLRQWILLTTEGRESDATIRSLLCHTAGVVDGDEGFYSLRMGDPAVSLMDILEGRTACNSRPVRAEKPQGTAFAYSDAGYCVLQLLVEEVTGKAFEDAAKELILDRLCLKHTFFASPRNLSAMERGGGMATGYNEDGQPLPGKLVPDLAASGLWSTPSDLLTIAGAFVSSLNGESDFLRKSLAREMAKPVEKFPWTGLGVFTGGKNILITQGWGENGQCMMKMNIHTGEIAAVMTNRDPGVDQAQSGVERLVNERMNKAE